MVNSRHVLGLGLLVILASVCGVDSRALPQGTVTQSGEPSHFQVDDKGAEIEVNANPAGVKVNAKPASLQVVAKPGTPAIPVYHPAIHVAPHYLPPPIVHRQPAGYFMHRRRRCSPCCPPMCFGASPGWFYAGLRRDGLPKPDTTLERNGNRNTTGGKSSQNSKKPDRGSLGRELDEDGNIISRNHKSSIPRPEKEHNQNGSNKRQFIAGLPRYMPQGIMGLGTAGYTMANTRAPLARNLISGYNGGQSLYSPYGASGLSSLYGQPLTNSGLRLGTFSGYGQLPASSSPRIYGAYRPIQQQFNSPISYPTSNSQAYRLGPSPNPKSSIINSFLQSELNHELYRPTATPGAYGVDQGYSRTIVNTPYGGLLSGRGIGGMGSLYGGPLASSGMGYQGGYLGGYSNSPFMQLAQLYAAMSPSMSPGLQQSTSTMPLAMAHGPLLSYPYMQGRSPLVGRSKVPGSRKNKSKHNHKRNSEKSKFRRKRQIVNRKKRSNDEKSRKKRQFLDQDLGGYSLDDVLQDALVNEFKREMILGSPQSQAPQLAPFTDQQSSLGLPFPGLPQVYGGNQQQTGNLMGLSQMAGLGANYVSPLQKFNSRNLGNAMAQSQFSSMALGRSQVSPEQLTLMPTMQERAPMASRLQMVSSVPLQKQLPQQQGFIQNRGNDFVGYPVTFNQDYRSPIQYEEERRPHYRRVQRHPLFRRRLHHNYYDDDYRDDYNDDRDDREMYRGKHIGRETISIGGPYSAENQLPNYEGETLVDTSNQGFGPITVEAKTAEGVRKSLGEDRRGKIAIPEEEQKSLGEGRRSRISILEEERKSLGEGRRGRIVIPEEEQKSPGEGKRGRIVIPEEEQKSPGEGWRGKITIPEEEEKSPGEGKRGRITIPEDKQKSPREGRRDRIATVDEEQKSLREGRRGKEEQKVTKKQRIPFKSGVL